jgi:hypothetical protein
MKRLLCVIALALACASCAIGPKVETRYVLVYPGQPVRVLSNAKVRAEHLETGEVSSQRIGGWVAMPPEHWEALKAKIDRLENR